jgi:hypothetical protein
MEGMASINVRGREMTNAGTENEKRFREYYELADRLIEVADKQTLAEVVRILAIHVVHYQAKYGKLSMEDTLKVLHSVTLTDDEIGTAADAMEYLVTVVGVASGLVDDDPVH